LRVTSRGLGDVYKRQYLPTMEEAVKIIKAQSSKGPSAEEQETQSKVELNKAKVQESGSVTALNMKKAQDIDTDDMFEMMAAKKGKLSAVQVD
jgi:translation elongation factor EF-G